MEDENKKQWYQPMEPDSDREETLDLFEEAGLYELKDNGELFREYADRARQPEQKKKRRWGILLWILGTSLSSPEGFEQASAIMGSFFVKFIMWGILTALAYHVVVGIRHMMMDFGYLEETFEAGKRSAKISFVITVVLSLLAGVLVW